MSAQNGIYFDEPVDVQQAQELVDRRRFEASGDYVQIRLVNTQGRVTLSEVAVTPQAGRTRYGALA